jgi:hypothetical protein
MKKRELILNNQVCVSSFLSEIYLSQVHLLAQRRDTCIPASLLKLKLSPDIPLFCREFATRRK